ncbi:hypothetical protein Btru_069778 [Bulinus truncatus]|nr:hypothetical protein Btru_069778 [Bulinus truncatus]
MDRLLLPRVRLEPDGVEHPIPESGSPLPRWQTLPMDYKFPVNPAPKGEVKFVTTKICHPAYKSTQKADFDLSDPYNRNIKSEYKSLHDPCLKGWFSNPRLRQQLLKQSLITESGNVSCSVKDFNDYRYYLRQQALIKPKTAPADDMASMARRQHLLQERKLKAEVFGVEVKYKLLKARQASKERDAEKRKKFEERKAQEEERLKKLEDDRRRSTNKEKQKCDDKMAEMRRRNEAVRRIAAKKLQEFEVEAQRRLNIIDHIREQKYYEMDQKRKEAWRKKREIQMKSLEEAEQKKRKIEAEMRKAKRKYEEKMIKCYVKDQAGIICKKEAKEKMKSDQNEAFAKRMTFALEGTDMKTIWDVQQPSCGSGRARMWMVEEVLDRLNLLPVKFNDTRWHQLLSNALSETVRKLETASVVGDEQQLLSDIIHILIRRVKDAYVSSDGDSPFRPFLDVDVSEETEKAVRIAMCATFDLPRLPRTDVTLGGDWLLPHKDPSYFEKREDFVSTKMRLAESDAFALEEEMNQFLEFLKDESMTTKDMKSIVKLLLMLANHETITNPIPCGKAPDLDPNASVGDAPAGFVPWQRGENDDPGLRREGPSAGKYWDDDEGTDVDLGTRSETYGRSDTDGKGSGRLASGIRRDLRQPDDSEFADMRAGGNDRSDSVDGDQGADDGRSGSVNDNQNKEQDGSDSVDGGRYNGQQEGSDSVDGGQYRGAGVSDSVDGRQFPPRKPEESDSDDTDRDVGDENGAVTDNEVSKSEAQSRNDNRRRGGAYDVSYGQVENSQDDDEDLSDQGAHDVGSDPSLVADGRREGPTEQTEAEDKVSIVGAEPTTTQMEVPDNTRRSSGVFEAQSQESELLYSALDSESLETEEAMRRRLEAQEEEEFNQMVDDDDAAAVTNHFLGKIQERERREGVSFPPYRIQRFIAMTMSRMWSRGPGEDRHEFGDWLHDPYVGDVADCLIFHLTKCRLQPELLRLLATSIVATLMVDISSSKVYWSDGLVRAVLTRFLKDLQADRVNIAVIELILKITLEEFYNYMEGNIEFKLDNFMMDILSRAQDLVQEGAITNKQFVTTIRGYDSLPQTTRDTLYVNDWFAMLHKTQVLFRLGMITPDLKQKVVESFLASCKEQLGKDFDESVDECIERVKSRIEMDAEFMVAAVKDVSANLVAVLLDLAQENRITSLTLLPGALNLSQSAAVEPEAVALRSDHQCECIVILMLDKLALALDHNTLSLVNQGRLAGSVIDLLVADFHYDRPVLLEPGGLKQAFDELTQRLSCIIIHQLYHHAPVVSSYTSCIIIHQLYYHTPVVSYNWDHVFTTTLDVSYPRSRTLGFKDCLKLFSAILRRFLAVKVKKNKKLSTVIDQGPEVSLDDEMSGSFLALVSECYLTFTSEMANRARHAGIKLTVSPAIWTLYVWRTLAKLAKEAKPLLEEGTMQLVDHGDEEVLKSDWLGAQSLLRSLIALDRQTDPELESPDAERTFLSAVLSVTSHPGFVPVKDFLWHRGHSTVAEASSDRDDELRGQPTHLGVEMVLTREIIKAARTISDGMVTPSAFALVSPKLADRFVSTVYLLHGY